MVTVASAGATVTLVVDVIRARSEKKFSFISSILSSVMGTDTVLEEVVGLNVRVSIMLV